VTRVPRDECFITETLFKRVLNVT